MLLDKFTSRPTEDILTDLYFLKVRENNGEKIEQPMITLLLGSNRLPVTGFLIDIKNGPKEKGVVMKLVDSNDVLFVDMFSVVGIAIRDADKIAPLLVEISPEDVANFPTVTRLDIRKQLADETTRLTTEFGSMNISFEAEVSTNATELYFTKNFLSDVSMSLIAIGKMDGGKQAIQEGVKMVKIKAGPDLLVNREDGSLIIHFPFNKSFTTNRSRNILVDSIYNVL
jgi:hypothetical protein